MNKKIVTIIVLVIVFLGLIAVVRMQGSEVLPLKTQSPQDATYIIGGNPVTLVHGISEVPAAPGSASLVTTRYFGNDVTADFNADGRLDSAFIMTQNTGGSGTFYYVVAALNTPEGYKGSQGLLLGDRIAPQSTNMATGSIVAVNYADRKPGESFAVAPSVGKTLLVKLDPQSMQLGEVVANFEGEANPQIMSLGQKSWKWVHTLYSDGSTVTPRATSEKAFVLTFKDKTFSISTDCNGVGGEYTTSGKDGIVFEKMMSTLMYCEGSQESDFSKMISEVQKYHFTSKGELVLSLKFDSGYMVFR